MLYPPLDWPLQAVPRTIVRSQTFPDQVYSGSFTSRSGLVTLSVSSHVFRWENLPSQVEQRLLIKMKNFRMNILPVEPLSRHSDHFLRARDSHVKGWKWTWAEFIASASLPKEDGDERGGGRWFCSSWVPEHRAWAVVRTQKISVEVRQVSYCWWYWTCLHEPFMLLKLISASSFKIITRHRASLGKPRKLFSDSSFFFCPSEAIG